MSPALLLAVLLSQPPAAPSPKLLGLVIGYNRSDDPKQAPLRYADDDAVKNAKLLKELGAEYVLLAQLDEDTKALYPQTQQNLPSPAHVRAAFDRLNARAHELSSAGHRTELLIFYTGHGDVAHHEGFVQLHGGKLTRTELRALLESSRADTTHLILDACKSYFMVFDRGPGGVRSPARGVFQDPQEALPKNLGLLLSTSSAQDSHEWEAFSAGVFSHEVRSALRGAADVNGDKSISYDEVAAFVWAANRAIPNPRFRPAVYARAPSGHPALLELAPDRGHRFNLGPGVQKHLYLEDAAGERILDLHPDAAQTVELLIPSDRPLFLRESRSGVEYPILIKAPKVQWGQLIARPTRAQSRGAEQLAFRQLFSGPFGPSALTQFQRRPTAVSTPAKPQPQLRWLRNTLGVASLATGLAGGALTGLALHQRGRADAMTSQSQRAMFNRNIRRYNLGASLLYAVSASTLVSFFVWLLWPQDQPDVELQTSP